MPTPSFYLRSLTLRAFRSVVDEQTLALPRTGMHLFLGPSGSGKTTIGEAVAFALGYSNFSAVDLQSWDWLTDAVLRDTLELETARGTLKVTRGKGASVHMPGEEKPRTSAKGVKEGLVQALGLDPELYLAPLTYRSQKTPSFFLSMRDGEKKSFLSQLLGLDAYERVADETVKRISELGTNVERAKVRHHTLLGAVPAEPTAPAMTNVEPLEAKVRAAEAQYEEARKQVDEMKKLDFDLTEHHARRVTAENEKWAPVLAQARTQQQVPPVDTSAAEAELAAVRVTVQNIRKEHAAKVAAAEAELDSARRALDGLRVSAAKKAKAQSALIQAKADRDQLRSEVCFTCQRPWSNDLNLATALLAAETHILELTATVDEASKAEAQIPAFAEAGTFLRSAVTALKQEEPVLQEYRDRETHLVGVIASAKAERNAKVASALAEYRRVEAEANKAVQALSAMTPEEEAVRRTLTDLQNSLQAVNYQVLSAKQTVSAARIGNNAALQYFDSMVQTRRQAMAEVSKAAQALADVEMETRQENDFLGMVRGFLSYIMDETLARIADATTARLALVPNVSDITLRFVSERETGSGKLRQEIVPVCEKNGHQVPLKAGISGGMYTVVELAVDLSLADVIAERTGVFPGWLILDEAFEGLDDICKNAVFDMLKDISRNRAVFVVDHACEMKELFDSRIEVRFDGAKTTIV